ncbi:hypothetical protein [Roseicyclus sp.]|uniref:hypothetical protein n=1 Tax=Roseicyclus sp. TaxID=1914329 RepID=UPI003F9F523D
MTTATLRTAPFRFARVGEAFAILARAIAAARGAQARLDRMQRLSALSDAELARRGLAREDIARHVFADMFAD